MNRQNKNAINQILSKVSERLCHRRGNLLYEAILELAPDNGADICEFFGIDRDSSHSENQEKIFDGIDILSEEKNLVERVGELLTLPVTVTVKAASELSSIFLGGNKKMFPIIITAIICIGVYATFQGFNQSPPSSKPKARQKPSGRSDTRDEDVYAPRTPTPVIETKKDAVLLLIIPANKINEQLISKLNSNTSLTSDEVISLFNKSNYYMSCPKPQVANYKNALNLDLNASEINADRPNDIFLEILIPEGEDTIGKNQKFALSRNIPDRVTMNVIFAVCNDSTNITLFNRD